MSVFSSANALDVFLLEPGWLFACGTALHVGEWQECRVSWAETRELFGQCDYSRHVLWSHPHQFAFVVYFCLVLEYEFVDGCKDFNISKNSEDQSCYQKGDWHFSAAILCKFHGHKAARLM